MNGMRIITLLFSSNLLFCVQVFAGPGNFGTLVQAVRDVDNIAAVNTNPMTPQEALWIDECNRKNLFVQTKALGFKHEQNGLTAEERKQFAGVGGFFCKHPNGSWRHFGSGFLTSQSRNHIATNAHVFIPEVDRTQDPCGGERDISKIKYFSEECGEFYNVVHAEKKTDDPRSNPNDDLAAIKLDKPLCNVAVGLKMKVIVKDQVSRMKESMEAGVVSTYPYAGYIKPDKLAQLKNSKFESTEAQNNDVNVQTSSRVVGYGKLSGIKNVKNGFMIEYTVSTRRGASGGPLVDKTKSDEVYGIHVGFENSASTHNWGIAFSENHIKWFGDRAQSK